VESGCWLTDPAGEICDVGVPWVNLTPPWGGRLPGMEAQMAIPLSTPTMTVARTTTAKIRREP
jgi:hypothetical protein